MQELTIDLEFSGLIPAPHEDEVSRLRQSLLDDGCRDPIVTWANHDDTILDGHTRYGICVAEEIPFKVKPLKFDSREAAKNWIVLNQLSRRNITDLTRTYLLGLLYNAAKDEHGGDRKSESKVQSEPLKNSAETVAEQQGKAPSTVKRAGKVADAISAVEKGTGTEVKNAILDGKVKATQGDVKALAEAPKAEQKKAAEKIKSGEAKSVKEAMGKKPRKKKPAQGKAKANFQEVRTYAGRLGPKIDDLAREKPGDKWVRQIHASITAILKAIDEWRAASK